MYTRAELGIFNTDEKKTRQLESRTQNPPVKKLQVLSNSQREMYTRAELGIFTPTEQATNQAKNTELENPSSLTCYPCKII